MSSTRPRGRAGTGSKDEMKTIIVAAGLMIEQGKILVTQREGGSPHGFLWEFPGGKVEEGEDPRQALQRELGEELGIKVEVGRFFDAILHPYPEAPVLLLFYHCRIEEGNAKPLKSRGLLWASPRELKELAMPAADDPIRQHLLSVEEEILSQETF